MHTLELASAFNFDVEQEDEVDDQRRSEVY